MADSALQRKNMVESQVRPSDVTDRRVTSAMTAIPRERFVPQTLASLAYSDEILVVGKGAVMLPPRLLAKLVQLAAVEVTDKVLVAGGAPGYAAAVMAELASAVVALIPAGGETTQLSKTLEETGCGNVGVVAASLAEGWPGKAPYNVIFIEGGIEQIPQALEAQLAEGGRLVTIEAGRGIGKAVMLQKHGKMLARREAFQASAPTLPDFSAARPAFVF